MIMLGFLAACIVVALGYAAKVYGEKTKAEWEIDNREFLIASLAMCLVVIPLTLWAGRHMAINSQVTFYENWNGWETRAVWLKTTCVRDGSCRHTYDCDPYTVTEYYDCSYTDSNGKRVSKTCDRQVTKYHSCPYASEEWYFGVKTTLGDHTIAGANVPTDPQKHRYRYYVAVPSYLQSGVPDRWTAVKNRLDAGNPGPVTERRSYENYILASQRSIIKRFNDSVDGYLKANLLPKLNSSVYDFYYLNRVYTVGVTLSADWQPAINRFNAAFGSTLQGDLHVVIVDAGQISNPDNYTGALMAYWQGPTFEKDALSKNAMVIVLGTKDGKTVDWARASTGMPIGNEHLVMQLQNELKGVALEPTTLLGYPTAKVLDDRKVAVTTSDGVLEKIVWGANRFTRVHMKPRDGQGGFTYLLNEIEPTTGQMIGILFVVLFLGCIAWGICIFYGPVRSRFGRR